MDTSRRKFCIAAATGAVAVGIAGAVAAEAKPKIHHLGAVTPGGEWPIQILEIEGRDGKIHKIPAWS